MRLAALLLLATSTLSLAASKPDDFHSILKRVEAHYGKRHMTIPFLGMVTFATHLTRPVGVSDFKLAIIEGEGTRLEQIPEFQPGPEWQPFIRTTSRSGERTVIYGRDEGRAVRALLVVIDRDQAVVMQMRLDPAHFARFVQDKSHH